MQNLNKIIQSHKSVICLDGTPPCEKAISLINPGAKVLAADGAAKWAEKQNAQLDFIIGDGDSASFSKTSSAQVVKINDQDTTDFEKCIGFARDENLLPSLILGISGGELDHILGNIQALLKHSEKAPLFFIDSYENNGSEVLKIGLPLHVGRYTFGVDKGARVSLIPFERSIVSSKGLVWELKEMVLEVEGILSVRNQALSEVIDFQVERGKVILIIDFRGELTYT
ncbi:MAG: thiamine diphosphokinase [Simkaniaceae bacterium]|nr:thiamine diphosphokinase [Simkaniaceae bacterium]